MEVPPGDEEEAVPTRMDLLQDIRSRYEESLSGRAKEKEESPAAVNTAVEEPDSSYISFLDNLASKLSGQGGSKESQDTGVPSTGMDGSGSLGGEVGGSDWSSSSGLGGGGGSSWGDTSSDSSSSSSWSSGGDTD